MTSNVKSCEPLFLGLHNVFRPSCIRRGGASKKRRLILLISVGWLPPYLPPSGACLSLGPSMPEGSLNAVEGYTKTGAASLPMHVGKPSELRVNDHPTMGLKG